MKIYVVKIDDLEKVDSRAFIEKEEAENYFYDLVKTLNQDEKYDATIESEGDMLFLKAICDCDKCLTLWEINI